MPDGTWTDVDFIKGLSGIHLRAILHEIRGNLIRNMCLEITFIKLQPVAIVTDMH